MPKTLRLTSWLLLVIVVLVIVLLTLLRFQPNTAIWAANQLMNDTQVSIEGLDVRYFPPNLALESANIELPDQTIDVTTAAAHFDASAWQTDSPFWSVTAGTVLIHSAAAPETREAMNLAVPNLAPFLSFTRVSVDKLEMTGDSRFTASLVADRQHTETNVEAKAIHGETQYVLTGMVTSTTAGPMPFNFNITGNPVDASASGAVISAQLQGVLSHHRGTELEIENGTATIGSHSSEGNGPQVYAQLFEQIKGSLRIPRSGDEVHVEGLRALFTSTDAGLTAAPLNINATTDFSAGKISLDTDGSLDQTDFSLALTITEPNSELRGNFDLESNGLPEGIEHSPYTSEQLFPAKFATEFKLTGTELILRNLTIDTPRNALEGSIDLSITAPWKLVADLDATKLFVPLVFKGEGAELANEVTERKPEPGDTDSLSDTKPDRLFSSDVVDWNWLTNATIDAKLDADELALQDAKFTDLKIALSNENGELSLDPLSASFGDGGFSGSSTLSLLTAEKPASGVSLTTLFQMSGVALEAFGLVPTEELSGGKVEANIDLSTRGSTQAELAAGLTGNILVMVEEATLMNDFIELAGSDLIMETLNKLNPFTKKDPTTELSCALVRFTADDGTLTTKNQLIIETSKMKIVGNGNIDLDSEKISLSITPNAKSGVGVNVGSAVKFLKLGGTLSAPSPAVSAGGLLKSGLAIGAAVSTGGVSVIAEGLAKRALNAGSACETARNSPGG